MPEILNTVRRSQQLYSSERGVVQHLVSWHVLPNRKVPDTG